jgi:hypothetical protein
MTDFAEEEYLITHIALGFDLEPLDDTKITDVKVTVYDSDGQALSGVDGVAMLWNPIPTWKVKVGTKTISGQGRWEKLWNTDGMSAGTYTAKAVITSLTGGKSVELLKRIRLKTDPLPVAP